MEADRIGIADSFFGMIKNLSSDVKLELMNKISDSLEIQDKAVDDDSWKRLFGVWKGEESAEEMIENIRTDRHTDRQLEDL